MRHRLFGYLAAAAAAVLVGLGSAAPAYADTQLEINPGNVPTTAAGFQGHSCDQIPGGQPIADEDGWVFVLPDAASKDGRTFVSVTAYFSHDGTTSLVTVTTTPSSDGAVLNTHGTSKAYVVTPAGWTLTNATAMITGVASPDFFTLTHTCPAPEASESASPTESASESASPTQSASESASPTESASGSASPTESASGSASPSESASGTPGPSGSASQGGGVTPSPSPSPAGQVGGLPITGVATGGLIALALGLIAAGVALRFWRRRESDLG